MRFEMICFGFFSIFAVPKNYVMKKTIIVGRKREMSELQHCMESDRSEFVIVYGRRRIGKTFLVDNFFHQQYDFSFVGGHRLSKEKQLRNFAKSLKLYAKLSSNPKFSDWDDAFDALEELMPDRACEFADNAFFVRIRNFHHASPFCTEGNFFGSIYYSTERNEMQE